MEWAGVKYVWVKAKSGSEKRGKGIVKKTSFKFRTEPSFDWKDFGEPTRVTVSSPCNRRTSVGQQELW